MIVEIEVANMEGKTNIVVLNNKLSVNNQPKDVDVESFLRKLFCIVASWEEEMVNLSVLDGESYLVKITNGDVKAKYFGKNKFPRNYGDFIELIDEVR